MTPPTNNQFDQAAEWLANHNHPLLITHAKPDGDALGSLVAMQALLTNVNTHPTSMLFDDIPARYQLFDRYTTIPVWEKTLHPQNLNQIDSVVIMDTSTYTQLEPIADWLRTSSLPKIVIDHHQTPDQLADHYLIDETASATCLILQELAQHMNWPIDPNTAKALFVGLAMDTGWFRHSNTDYRTLSAASQLVMLGVQPHALHQILFQQDTQSRVRLLGAAINDLELHCSDQLAIMTLSIARMHILGATPADTEDIINEPLRISGVIVSVLLVETQHDLIRISFRSKPLTENTNHADLDVSNIARHFGGGGHRRAAGARLTASIEVAREQIIDHISALLTN